MSYNKRKIEEYKKLNKLFLKQKIDSIPIKLYSNDEDIDIVVVKKENYPKATKILKKLGFKVGAWKARLREPLKCMYKSSKFKSWAHLHSTISWNGIRYHDPKLVWKRKIRKQGIYVPSPEDEILIIAAHSIFENKRLVREEREYLKNLLKNNSIDWKYIKKIARDNNWEAALNLFLKEKDSNIFRISDLLNVSFSKFGKDLTKLHPGQMIWYLFSYTFLDYVWCYRNTVKKFRKKRIIALSGIDGSGKTTQAKLLFKKLKEDYKIEYSHAIKRSTAHKFKKTKLKNKFLKNEIRKMLALFDLLKFRTKILFTNNLILTDRFYYDILVHIKCFGKTNFFDKLFISLIPKAQILYLELDPNEAFKRKPDHNLSKLKKSHNLHKKFKNKYTIINKGSIESMHKQILEKLRLP